MLDQIEFLYRIFIVEKPVGRVFPEFCSVNKNKGVKRSLDIPNKKNKGILPRTKLSEHNFFSHYNEFLTFSNYKTKITNFFDNFDLEEVSLKIVKLYSDLSILSNTYSKRHDDLNFEKQKLQNEYKKLQSLVEENKKMNLIIEEENNVEEKLIDKKLPSCDQINLYSKMIDETMRDSEKFSKSTIKNYNFFTQIFIFFAEYFYRYKTIILFYL